MATRLAPCPGCARHVRAGDALCPFCGADVPALRDPAPSASLAGAAAGDGARSFWRGTLLLGAVGCAATLAACEPNAQVAAYGAPPPPPPSNLVPAPTSPDASPPPATPAPPSGSVVQAVYGGPPPVPPPPPSAVPAYGAPPPPPPGTKH